MAKPVYYKKKYDTPEYQAKLDDALKDAADEGDWQFMRKLIQHGANIHTDDDRALRRAAAAGDTPTVEFLLDYGADIHAMQEMPLNVAVTHNRHDTIKLLLDRGAHVHARNHFVLTVARNAKIKEERHLKEEAEYKAYEQGGDYETAKAAAAAAEPEETGPAAKTLEMLEKWVEVTKQVRQEKQRHASFRERIQGIGGGLKKPNMRPGP